MLTAGRARDVSGAEAVEFALVVPLFLAVVFFALTAGWILTAQALLQRGAEVGARAAAVPDQITPVTGYRDGSQVLDAARQASIFFDGATFATVPDEAATAGEVLTVGLTHTITVPGAPVWRTLLGVEGVDDQVTLTATAQAVRE